jgi:hypothetical protein
MEKTIEIQLQKEIINSYEAVCKTSDELITLQKKRIEELQDEIKVHKEAVERLLGLLDETIAIAKNQISKNQVPPTTLN